MLLAEGPLDLMIQIIGGEAKVPPQGLVVGQYVFAQIVGCVDHGASLFGQIRVLSEQAHVVEFTPVGVDAFGAQKRGHVAAVEGSLTSVFLGVQAERQLGKKERLVIQHEHWFVLVIVLQKVEIKIKIFENRLNIVD